MTMDKGKELTKRLFFSWTKALHSHQAAFWGNPKLDGALICPACGKIHGRCVEAIYPFMAMARTTGLSFWSKDAERLFDWAEETVSQPDGSFLNDIDSDWKGTSVFAAISFVDTLEDFGTILEPSFKKKLEGRLLKASKYLCSEDSYLEKNTNYPVSIALLLYRSGLYFSDEKLLQKAEDYKRVCKSVMTPEGFIFGEGFMRNGRSARNLLAIDIGYNVEETLPAMVKLGILTKDEELLSIAERGFSKQLEFMLCDGAWDNSFGTRNFKWTYWGSRTSDGAAEGLLLLKERNALFSEAAYRNLLLMEQSTHDGLLSGGPHYGSAMQPTCIHHTFTHVRPLVSILVHDLWDNATQSTQLLPRYQKQGVTENKDIASFVYTCSNYTATITAYDWPYMPAGHTSGGTLSLLHSSRLGPILISGMGEYWPKEKNNMQLPQGKIIHECLDLRIEMEEEDRTFSSRECMNASLTRIDKCSFLASGILMSKKGEISTSPVHYEISYHFKENIIEIIATCKRGTLVCPIVSRHDEEIVQIGNKVLIEKN